MTDNVDKIRAALAAFDENANLPESTGGGSAAVEELRRRWMIWNHFLDTQFHPEEARALLARLDAAEKDSERYRWLRDRATPGFRPSADAMPLNYSPVRLRVETAVHDPSRWGSDVDFAIDAAMKENQ